MAKRLNRLLAALAATATLATGITASAWGDTLMPGEDQPASRMLDPHANDDMVKDYGGGGDGREADSTSNLTDSDQSTKNTGRSRSAARSASNKTLAEGQITSGVHDVTDPATSVYVGGNLLQKAGTETEGSVVVNGNMYIGGTNDTTISQGHLAGKVMWGLGYNPPAGADMLAIGGDFINRTNNPQWVSGATRIGGKMAWGDGNTGKNQNNNWALYIATDKNMTDLGWAANSSARAWIYKDLPSGTRISTGLGKSSALKVNIDGKGKTVDYGNYTDSTLKPLSAKLKGLPSNGTVSYASAPDDNAWTYIDDFTVKISNEGKIVFTGNGKAEKQVFNLNLSDLDAYAKQHGIQQWSLDFENVPDGQAIVVNATGTGDYTWHTGWRVWVNGKDYGTHINALDESKSRFRNIASRIMWNFSDISNLKMDYSHGISDRNAWNAVSGKDVYGTVVGKGVLFPGSILLPNGSMYDIADTNGRLLIGKDLTFDIWEHHNSPWVGFDEPQKFTVQGATRKNANVSYGDTDAVSDTVTLNSTGANGTGNTVFDLNVSNLTATLAYRDASGQVKTSTAKALPAVKLTKDGAKTTVTTPTFSPSDLGMKYWQAGDYWFDIQGGGVSITDASDGTKATLTKTGTLDGSNDADESFSLAMPATPSIGTKAVASGATAGGTQPVHDSITVTNPDPNRAVTLAKVTTTLHVKGGKTASKTVTGKTIPAGGSLTFDSATFTPSDLGDKTWKAGVTYWFDATVKASDASYPSGAQALTADLNHDGSNDAAQQFKLTMDADFSTKAQDTFTQAGGTGAVHDRLLLKSGSDALTADLDVRVTLNWNASPTGTAGTKSLTKAGVFKAGAASSDLPDFTPSDFGWTSWKGGRYWYDVTIPAQNGISSTTLKGLQKDVAAESWTAAVPWTLDLAKLAYIGQPGSGRWDDEPVKGATFTLTETTDRTGGTAVSGAKPLTVTTDRNGRAHLTDGTIATDGVKWFKLVETQAPSSYKTPDAGTFWMVKVTGSADGATVTVTGSDKTAQALLKSVDGSTLTVGDQFQGNIMPPLTGGTYDVMRGLALAGGIMLAMLAGGVLWTRRRTDARHAR